MDLSIIILNYRTKEITAECLRSISNSQDSYSKEVIVVDNESGDGSVEYLKHKFPEFTIISSGKNDGFAYGNNVGAKKAKGTYVWLLNSDTILQKDTIQLLLDNAFKHDSALATCTLLNKDGSIQPQGGALPTLWNLIAWMTFFDDIPLLGKLVRPYQQRSISYYQKDQHPGWVGGTALLVKRKVYEQLHGLDQSIFMYGEDTDFCLRAKQAGFSINYFALPKLTHLGQASGDHKGAILGEYQGLKHYFQAHQPAWQFFLLRMLLKIGSLLRIVLFGMILGDEKRKNIYLEAFHLA